MAGHRPKSVIQPPVDLTIVGQQPERADAARNRHKILEAAAAQLAADGVDGLRLEDVARAANVGVGTIYRRFGNQAGLIFALLDERERQFQAGFLSGPPPLGPGAPPANRIRAFLHALVERVDAHREVLAVAEISSATARYTGGPYALYHAHLSGLLDELGVRADPHQLADMLLATASASLISYQRQQGFTVKAIKTGLDELLESSWRCG